MPGKRCVGKRGRRVLTNGLAIAKDRGGNVAMGKSRKGLTRRDFLCTAAGAAAAGAVGVPGLAQEMGETAETVKKAKVVLVRDAGVLDPAGNVKADVIERMLDDAVTTLFGVSDPVAPWKELVKPTDTVGVKTNVWNFLPTPKELETAIKNRLMEAGVREERIGISDRGVRKDPVFQQSTALINVRPMRTHHWAGVGSCIKNFAPFAPSIPKYHPDSCADLAGIWQLPEVKGKNRLNILVMLTPLFHGKGPHHFQKEYTWPYKGLLVGTDPVAVDATGVRILEAKRREHFGEDRPFDVSPKHIRVAQDKFKLGIADPERIEVVKVGWMDDVLV